MLGRVKRGLFEVLLGRGAGFIALGFFLLAALRTGLAQENKIDVNSLIQETQKRSDAPAKMTLVWWILEEYWQATFAQNPNMKPEQIEEFVKVFRPYTLIAVVDGKVGAYGTVAYKSEAEIRSAINIADSQGTIYSPLGEEEVNMDTKGLLSMMKPMLANALGPIGQNMYFFIFPAKSKEGQRIGDATKEGVFSVKLEDNEFQWKLPLSSLLPQKTCTVCKERLNGSYKFCPWDGTKL